MSLILATTALQAGFYGCSAGELQDLIVPGSEGLEFVKWQDRYLVPLDVSYQAAVIVADLDKYDATHFAHLEFRPPNPRAKTEIREIFLRDMLVPYTITTSVHGARQSQKPTSYEVFFATQKKLPLLLRLSDPSGDFRRCLSWGAIAESELSIPPELKQVKVSVVFADFVIGPPYSADFLPDNVPSAVDTTWTTFVPSNLQSCQTRCFCRSLPLPTNPFMCIPYMCMWSDNFVVSF